MQRLVFAIYRLFEVVIGWLSIEAVFRLGWGLGTLVYYFAWPYRRLVLHNLRIAFGAEKSPDELRGLAREHFATLGANLLCGIKIPQLSREEIMARVTVEGLDEIKAQGIIQAGFTFVISHLGCWELWAQLTRFIYDCPGGTIFRAIGNRYIDAAIRRDRAKLGLALFERKEGLVQACRFIRNHGAVGMLMDQHAGDGGLWCPFFGRLASTSTLAASIALRTTGWMFAGAFYTEGVARWRCVLSDWEKVDGQTAEAITVRINQILEKQIRHHPADWFWVHNRWKTPEPTFLLRGYKRGVALPAGMEAKDLKPFRILIRASNWLGDAIMSVPAVSAIKRGRIDAHVTILTPAKLADVWRSVAEVDEVIAIDPGENVFAVARKIRRDFDVAILFPNSVRVALEAWLAGIPTRVGYAGHNRRALLNEVFTPKKKKKELQRPQHQVHHYLALAQYVGVDIKEAMPATAPQPLSRDTKPVIGLCAGAEYGGAKRWLPERFAEVVKQIQERTGAEWKIFGVANDRPITDAIVSASGVPCTDLVGKTTLAQLMEELRTCRLLLSNDTGTMHLAAFLGVPTISLFGSTEPILTGPLGPNHRIIRHHVACSPCFLRECPIDFRCMKAITAAEVAGAVLSALAN